MRFPAFVKPLIWASVILGLGYLVLSPFYFRVIVFDHHSRCQSNVHQIMKACQQYTQDYGNRFPPLSHDGQGWADLLQPYAKGWAIFHCPTTGKFSNARSSDYFLNARVATLPISKLEFPDQTLSFGDGEATGATNSHLLELSLDWKTDENAPARRHLYRDGANYTFVDGHVKFMKPDKISTQSPMRDDNWIATFAVR